MNVISVLTGTENPRRYWSDLKRKLKKEGAVELYEKIVQLKMLSSDGKRYKTDVANNVLSKFRLNIKPGLIIDTCEKIHPINEKAYSFPVYLL